MRSIAALTLWLFVIGTSLILGAGLYETLVVVPFWSAGAPASLAEGNPLLQVHIRAGHVFWQYFTPALGLIAVLALLAGFWVRALGNWFWAYQWGPRFADDVGSCFP